MSTDYKARIAPVADGSGQGGPDLSPQEAVGRWLNKLRVSKRESTVSAYHYQLKHFVEFCEDEGIVSLDELSGWNLETFETRRREQDLEVISLNKELGTLQNFLEYCARVELVDEDLPEKVVPPDVPADEQVDKKRLRPSDARDLLGYYDEHAHGTRAHALLTLAWYTGARLGGLRGADVSDYNSDEQYIQFLHRPEEETPLKNGYDGERAVGLPDYVCDVVDEYLAEERHDVYDDYGRRPLLASELGRPSENSIRAWTYLATVPCLHSACPHGNERETCEFVDYSKGSQCPSSRSPTKFVRGASRGS